MQFQNSYPKLNKFRRSCISHQRYTVGNGGFGEVTVRRKKENYQLSLVAVKRLFQLTEEAHRKSMMNEIEHLSSFNHKNIIRFHGMHLKFSMVMEYLDYGSFFDLITKYIDVEYRLAHVLHWLKQTSDAIFYLHNQANYNGPIMHRDINCKNIMLHQLGQEIKLVDFGLSKHFVCSTNTGQAGTRHYRAPEVIGEEDETAWRTHYNEQSDIYSFGVVMLELFHRRILKWFPAKSADHAESLAKLTEPLPEMLRHIVISCSNKRGEARPKIRDLQEVLTLFVQSVPYEKLSRSKHHLDMEKMLQPWKINYLELFENMELIDLPKYTSNISKSDISAIVDAELTEQLNLAESYNENQKQVLSDLIWQRFNMLSHLKEMPAKCSQSGCTCNFCKVVDWLAKDYCAKQLNPTPPNSHFLSENYFVKL